MVRIHVQAPNTMNQDYLYIKLKYSLSPEKHYNGLKDLPLDFLIKFGYVIDGTTNPHDAYILRNYEMENIISDLLVYETMAP